jgi:hypothetical protein
MTRLRLQEAPTGWWLKAIRAPVTQSPSEPVNASTDIGVVLVVSNQSARVEAQVVENSDAPSNLTFVLFSTNEREWSLGSPYLRIARANGQRALALSMVPPGEYYIAAVAEPEMMLDNDEMTTVLSALRRVATRITLHAGDQQRHELRPMRLRR